MLAPPPDVVEGLAVIPADVGWRIEQYVKLGLETLHAVTLAEVRDPTTGWFADWHRFASLVDRGCPPRLAFEILV